MRPSIDEDVILDLKSRADEVSKFDAEHLSVEQQLRSVLATIDEIDNYHQENGRWWQK